MTLTDTSERRPIFKREVPLPPVNPDRPMNLAMRMLAARVIASVKQTPPANVAAERWPSDLVMRAAVSPAMTTTTGWAAELAIRVVRDELEALGARSAGAELLQEGLVLTLDNVGSVSAPGFVADGSNASFVAEGNPIPVRQLAATAALLQAYKLAVISVLTREMIESSNAEQVIRDALVRSAGLALDAALFDNAAASAARPAGLRNGIAALTASNNADAIEAALEDVGAIISAVSAVAGNSPISVVASAGRVAALSGSRFAGAENIHFRASSAVGNDLVALAPAALVVALSPEPDVETANAGTLHMDSGPQPVGSVAPHRSLFQTDSIAIKVRWPVSWALRDTRGVAWLTPSWK